MISVVDNSCDDGRKILAKLTKRCGKKIESPSLLASKLVNFSLIFDRP
jgi:hypothetical protein